MVFNEVVQTLGSVVRRYYLFRIVKRLSRADFRCAIVAPAFWIVTG